MPWQYCKQLDSSHSPPDREMGGGNYVQSEKRQVGMTGPLFN